jgi:SAM-dependent methyltransferase
MTLFVGDACSLSLASNSADVILSTSTLDHFDNKEEFDRALAELIRVLRPGGRLLLTVDNASNPLYRLLRRLSRLRRAPFKLGYTPSRARLDQSLTAAGLKVTRWRPLIHNPRLLSTLYFLGARKLLGRAADPLIRFSLGLFELFSRLPTRWITCCFVGVCAVKPEAHAPPMR